MLTSVTKLFLFRPYVMVGVLEPVFLLFDGVIEKNLSECYGVGSIGLPISIASSSTILEHLLLNSILTSTSSH